MMLTRRYIHALGDYVIEFIGLKSWTGDFTGIHLTIFYFGALTFLGLYLVRKYALKEWGIRKRKAIFLFIVFITIFSLMTNMAVKSIKKYSDGLLSIGYHSKTSIVKCYQEI